MTTQSWRLAMATRLLSVVLVSAIVAPANAALLVYEGFDTGGVDGNTLHGLAGATSFGFDSGSSWSVTVSGTGAVTYETTGLTFSNLVVVGGRANVNAGSSSGDGSRALDVAATGTVYGSYLVNPVAAQNADSISSILVGSQASLTTNDSGSQWDFQANADVYASTLGGGRINGAFPSGSYTNTGTALSVGTTYLVLFEMDNLVNSGTTSQTLTTWILTAAQFDNFKPGGITAAELNSATVGTTSADVIQRGTLTGTFGSNLTVADFYHIYAVLGGANARLDELRLSDATLNEVAPLVEVPEPSALALLFGGSLAMMRFARRCGK
jgi:hypothetical protein